jgi:hypothetical protein
MRLVVAALAVCPAMSLLGAKRPQHGVWQLIVASLAVVIAMPALSAWLVRPGSLPDVHLLGRGFLAVLAAVGWMNFLATQNGLSATAITAGQLAVIRPFLPGIATDRALPQDSLDCFGACLIAAGAVLAMAWPVVRGRGASASNAADALRRLVPPGRCGSPNVSIRSPPPAAGPAVSGFAAPRSAATRPMPRGTAMRCEPSRRSCIGSSTTPGSRGTAGEIEGHAAWNGVSFAIALRICRGMHARQWPPRQEGGRLAGCFSGIL